MRLHRLRLTSFRGVADREVHFPDSGVVVLEGANEVGKTSMVEALDLLLTEKDSSAKRQVRSVQTVGQDVGSEVEAEISTGIYRLTYRKRWHVRPRTELVVHSPVREQLTGVPAHERVRAILAETVDDGLWKALRLMQSAPLQQDGLSGSTALAAALDAAAGDAADLVDAADAAEQGSLLAAVETEFLRFHTPTGRPTGDHARVVLQRDRAEATAAAARAALAEVARDVGRSEVLVLSLAALAEQRTAAQTGAAALEVRWARVEQLEAGLDRRRREAVAARLAGAAASTALASRLTQVRVLAERRAVETAATTSATAGRAEVERLSPLVAAAADSVAAAQAVESAAAQRVSLARLASDHLRDRADLERLDARVLAVAAASTQLEQAVVAASLETVTDARLRRVETAATTTTAAVARQEAAAPHVRVETLGGADVLVDGVRVDAAAGDRPVTGPLEVEVPGVVRVTVLPGADAGQLAAAVAAARADLAEALALAGASDVDDARRRHRRHLDTGRDVVAARRELAGHLGSEDLDRLRARADALRACLPAGGDAEPPLDLAAARVAVEAVTTAWTRAAADLQEAVDHHARLRDRLTACRLDTVALETALSTRLDETDRMAADLEQRRSADPDDALAAASAEAVAAAQAATEHEAAAWSELDAADAPAVREQVTAARTRLHALVTAWDDGRLDLAQVRGRLESAGAQGRQDTLDEALTALEAAERECTAVLGRARAVALLRETLLRHRDAARRRYVTPFAAEVTALGEVVFGPSFGVEVDDELRIATRTLDGTTVPFDLLSTGAKEQLAVITRLACAGLVDEVDGVPVIIDDALGWSDPGRLARVAEVVELAGRRSQVILLTCTPDRYRSIGTATVVPLTA